MEQHRDNPACATCHKVMDPSGSSPRKLRRRRAVENQRTRRADRCFGPACRWHQGHGRVADLRKALLEHPEQFVATVTEKMLTYALGRGLEYYDMPVVRGIVREAARSNYRFSSLVMGIVRSAPFEMRKAPPAEGNRSPRFDESRFSGVRPAHRLSRRMDPTLNTLQALHLAHATHIPFENLDVLWGRPSALDIDTLAAKLIDGRRGGYCFEQNALFAAVLEQIGFPMIRLAARVRLGAARIGPRTHMLLAVGIEGEKWLADVGSEGMDCCSLCR